MTLTHWFLLATVIAWVLFDIWVGITKGGGQTLSVVIWQLSSKYPPLPFAIGLLVGHLLLQMPGLDCKQ